LYLFSEYFEKIFICLYIIEKNHVHLHSKKTRFYVSTELQHFLTHCKHTVCAFSVVCKNISVNNDKKYKFFLKNIL